MTNAELAKKYNEISSANIATLTDKELKYRLMMESAKIKFKLNDDDIKDAILNGTGTMSNRRWKGRS